MATESMESRLLQAQADGRCAMLKIVTALSELHTATLVTGRQSRIIADIAIEELEGAKALLSEAIAQARKKTYRPRKKQTPQRKPRAKTAREIERAEARRGMLLNG